MQTTNSEKYYLAKMEVHHGESSYIDTQLWLLNDSDLSIEEVLSKYEKHFFASPESAYQEEGDEAWYHFDGEYCVVTSGYEEVPSDHYAVLQLYLYVHYPKALINEEEDHDECY